MQIWYGEEHILKILSQLIHKIHWFECETASHDRNVMEDVTLTNREKIYAFYLYNCKWKWFRGSTIVPGAVSQQALIPDHKTFECLKWLLCDMGSFLISQSNAGMKKWSKYY